MVGPWVVRPCFCDLLSFLSVGGAWLMCDLGPCAPVVCILVLCPSFVGGALALLSAPPLLVGLRCVYDLRPCAFLICLLFAGGPLAFLVPFCVLPAVLVWRSFVTLPLSPFPAPLRFLDLSLSASCLLFCCLLFAGGPSAFLSLSSPFPAPLCFLDLSLSASYFLFCCLVFAGGPWAFLVPFLFCCLLLLG